MTVRLHVGEVSIGVGVGLQQHQTSLLRRVVPVVAESARFVGSNPASLRRQRLDLFEVLGLRPIRAKMVICFTGTPQRLVRYLAIDASGLNVASPGFRCA